MSPLEVFEPVERTASINDIFADAVFAADDLEDVRIDNRDEMLVETVNQTVSSNETGVGKTQLEDAVLHEQDLDDDDSVKDKNYDPEDELSSNVCSSDDEVSLALVKKRVWANKSDILENTDAAAVNTKMRLKDGPNSRKKTE
ncbi:unnamed protein product [Acanthoscelides obtectus]|uniref:Uncharacterized protein n=1 Tax=Acanthoscelides obtectus TaxID=200917 RepID=A0A9P0MKK3_ACAOB|nr:unnamed protein product [Acanthoscelides obtectus]